MVVFYWPFDRVCDLTDMLSIRAYYILICEPFESRCDTSSLFVNLSLESEEVQFCTSSLKPLCKHLNGNYSPWISDDVFNGAFIDHFRNKLANNYAVDGTKHF